MSLYSFQLYILNFRSIFPFFKIKRHPTKDTSKPLGLFELGKESYNVSIIVYYIYANYTTYIQLTCIIYLNYFYWYHFGSS